MEEQPQPVFIRNIQSFKVGLSWDLLQKEADLDASCFVFDEFGNLLDIVYYNQITSKDNAIIHSGDERTGETEGFDEIITVYVPTLHISVHFLVFVVTVHSKHTFADIETATCTAWDGAGEEIISYMLGSFGKHKAMVMSMVAKLNGTWYFYRLGHPSFAPTLAKTLPDLDNALKIVIPEETLANRKTVKMEINISKGDEYDLKVYEMFLGLGWDAGCDLDAWCYMVGPDGTQISVVYYGDLKSSCGSVRHSGDNLTGEGEGDDEQINVNLKQVPITVQYLFFVVKIYTSGKRFDSVRNPFVRLVDVKLDKQLCIFKPQQIASNSNALIVGAIHRTPSGCWSFLAMGIGAEKDRISSKTLHDTFCMQQKGRERELLFKVLVVGDVATGKTSIIKRFVNGTFFADYKSTIGVDFTVKVIPWDERTTVKLQLWDIAGQERFASMTRVYYNGAVGAIIVLDVSREITFEGAEIWKRDIDSKITLPGTQDPIPVVVFANKIDSLEPGQEIQLRERMEQLCKNFSISAWFETSAKEDICISDAMTCLVRQMIERAPVREQEEQYQMINLSEKTGTQEIGCSC